MNASSPEPHDHHHAMLHAADVSGKAPAQLAVLAKTERFARPLYTDVGRY
jgi:hypothetical protein